ncbi:MAG: hypothetical protein U0904_11585, partial [Candidatus Nanopelagicales bacterium]|nr:hypothetical protein [Candidatus Nanopelagicales bacterium]
MLKSLPLRVRNKLATLESGWRFPTGVVGILAQKSARQNFRHLWDAEVSVYSQWGEDGILDYLCDHVDLPRPSCLELGRFRLLRGSGLAMTHRSAAGSGHARHRVVPPSVGTGSSVGGGSGRDV